MARVRWRHWTVASLGLLVLAAIVAPPLIGLNRFEQRIAASVGRAIGRPVRMSSAKIRLLPRPGFEIADFVVEEDPAFGVEPILRCEQVTAYARLLPLWRGHLEIARISFDGPSLNLVRNREGRWNFDAVLSQAAQVQSAPTGGRHLGGVPRFPYISASDARVNFKYGDEKMPFSFLNADLAVWLENPDEWRVKFAAQPVRTDLSLDLANTGTLRLEGSLRRGPAIRQMPADLHVEWSNAPLGQLSRIFSGTDTGWRGDLNFAATILGSADHADLTILAQGRGIHRVEFEPREPMNLDATCKVRFTRAPRSFDSLTCLTPLGTGHLLLTGSIHDRARTQDLTRRGHESAHNQVMASTLDPALSLEINNVPAATALDGLRLMRPGFASEVEATGVIDGNFSFVQGSSAQPELNGQATASGVTFTGPALKKPWVLPELRFISQAKPGPRLNRSLGSPRSAATDGNPLIRLEPFMVEPATAANSDSLTVSAIFSQLGFSVHFGGESHVRNLVSLLGEFSSMQPRDVAFGPQGMADADLTVRGPWVRPLADPEHPVDPMTVDGSLRIRNAELTGDFLAQPLQLTNAQVVFAEHRANWNATSMTYGPIHGEGTLSYPVFCLQPLGCQKHFTLHIATLDAATAQNALLGARRHGELLQELLDRIGPGAHPWPALDGTAQIGMLTLHGVAIRDVAASLSVKEAGVQVKSFSGRVLDGLLQLSGEMQVVDGSPRYVIEARLDRATAVAVAGVFQEDWGSGTITADAKLKLSGFDANQLASSATGIFHWNWTKGGLPLVASSNAPADSDRMAAPDLASTLGHFDSWTAAGTIAEDTLTVKTSMLTRGLATTSLTGTVGFDRALSLIASGGASGAKLSGTFQHPAIGAPDVAVAKASKP
jgi:hypothetical protein